MNENHWLFVGLIKCGAALEAISAELHTANKIALNKAIVDEDTRRAAKNIDKQLRETLAKIDKRNAKLIEIINESIREEKDE